MNVTELVEGAAAAVVRPLTASQVLTRISNRLDGDVSIGDLRKVAQMLDRAAFEADGAVVSGVLFGLMIGLEAGSGASFKRVNRCVRCEEPIQASGTCSERCHLAVLHQVRLARRSAIGAEKEPTKASA